MRRRSTPKPSSAPPSSARLAGSGAVIGGVMTEASIMPVFPFGESTSIAKTLPPVFVSRLASVNVSVISKDRVPKNGLLPPEPQAVVKRTPY